MLVRPEKKLLKGRVNSSFPFALQL